MSATYSSKRAFSSQAFADLEEFVRSERPTDEGLETFERELRERVSAFATQIMGERLQQFDIDVERIEIAEEVFVRVGRHEKIYRTLSGDVPIERTIYRPQGGGKAIAPLEVQAGVVEGCWTPLLARVMARTVASTTPKEAADLFVEFGGARPSSSSLDRLPKKLSEIWELARPAFEKELREEEEIPASATSVAVSLDGVQVPMQDGERKSKRTQPERRPTGPTGYREVGCGTVSFFDSDGEWLSTVRYARMLEHKKATLKEELREELQSIYNVRSDLTLGLLADGAVDNWDFLRSLPGVVGAEDSHEVSTCSTSWSTSRRPATPTTAKETPRARRSSSKLEYGCAKSTTALSESSGRSGTAAIEALARPRRLSPRRSATSRNGVNSWGTANSSNGIYLSVAVWSKLHAKPWRPSG